jgi:hypothetical protein
MYGKVDIQEGLFDKVDVRRSVFEKHSTGEIK